MRFEVSDDTRRALADRFGEKGLATRESVRAEILAVIEAHWETVSFDYDRNQQPGEWA